MLRSAPGLPTVLARASAARRVYTDRQTHVDGLDLVVPIGRVVWRKGQQRRQKAAPEIPLVAVVVQVCGQQASQRVRHSHVRLCHATAHHQDAQAACVEPCVRPCVFVCHQRVLSNSQMDVISQRLAAWHWKACKQGAQKQRRFEASQ